MKYFFTSDHHFFHKNIIKHCNRPFSSIEEMNEEMIKRWNEKITNEDIVYHLGDFCWIKSKYGEIINRLKFKRLNLIPGSHDKVTGFNSFEYLRNTGCLKNNKLSICHPLIKTKIENQNIVLCHYPMISWDKSHYGSWQLFGHAHGFLNNSEKLSLKQLDIGVDTNNFYPYSFEDIKQKIDDNMWRKEVFEKHKDAWENLAKK